MDGSGILSFFGLLAIIIVGIFIVVFIVDWLLHSIDGRKGIFFKSKLEKEENYVSKYQNNDMWADDKEDLQDEEEFSFDDKKVAEEQKKVEEEDFTFDFDEEDKNDVSAKVDANDEFSFEDEGLKERSNIIDSREEEEFNFDDDFMADEKEVYSHTDEEYDNMISEITNKVMANHTTKNQSEQSTETVVEKDVEEFSQENTNVEDDFDFDANSSTDNIVENNKTMNINSQETTTTTTTTEIKEETIVDNSVVNDADMEAKMVEIRKELEAQIASLQEQLKQQQQENAILKATSEKEKEELLLVIKKKAEDDDNGESRVIISGNIPDLEEKLNILRERLKINEKDLRLIKKEFIPLRKVKHLLEKDEKKLRRREAMVAKQKVVLYGVNNYVDLDEEKAKKLTEDLDLLEGLKFSVAHCEEVMEKNKERYPILETTYNILMQTNAQIKDDIAEVENAISILEQQMRLQHNEVAQIEANTDSKIFVVDEDKVESVDAETIQDNTNIDIMDNNTTSYQSYSKTETITEKVTETTTNVDSNEVEANVVEQLGIDDVKNDETINQEEEKIETDETSGENL